MPVNTATGLVAVASGCWALLWLQIHSLVLSSPRSVWKETFMAPISQMQVRKVKDLLQAFQLLGTVPRLER